MAAADESKTGVVSECCPPGSHPALVLDEARESMNGKIVTLPSGLVTYQVPPPTNAETCKRAVIIVYDVHGFSGGRIKGVCDTVAKAGFHVVMPDVYGDELGVNDKGGFASDTGKTWLKTYTWERLQKNFQEVIDVVLKPKGITHTGALGFCWGAYVVFKMSAANMINAGASCHPSLGVGPLLFDDPVEEQCAAVSTPILLCPAGNDREFVKPGGMVESLLKDRGIAISITEFPEMKHGWVPRGDATVKEIARDVTAALTVVSKFFDSQLK